MLIVLSLKTVNCPYSSPTKVYSALDLLLKGGGGGNNTEKVRFLPSSHVPNTIALVETWAESIDMLGIKH